MSVHAPGLTGSPLDRVDAVRTDPDAYAALRGDWRARVLTLDGFVPRLSDTGALVWGSLAEIEPDSDLALLGLIEGRPHFVALTATEMPPPMRSPAMFAALAMLRSAEAAIFAAAYSLLAWHANHPFCARCGLPTEPFRAGWGRKCPAGHDHFPRVDPVVIMLATRGERALVGRQARFPKGNYSALAGYLEPGESIEEAVRREVKEEAGITVGAVTYLASQPWPFGGAQLMIACFCDALDEQIVLDPAELEDAMWVTRDEVRAVLAGETDARFKVPPPFAIAHTLFRAWAA